MMGRLDKYILLRTLRVFRLALSCLRPFLSTSSFAS